MADAESPEKKRNPPYSPTQFMRGRRPYLYSDSGTEIEYALTRELLSHHLDTLTSRNEEATFERFARRVAEAEICPNLRPNTGPSGGGDSKVDTETYPVSEEVAERWYWGEREAASQRWAFAISAKKDWKAKVRSDVQKIIGTERGYERIYFITSRSARAKDRAELEDELSKLHGVPLTILDVNWIVEKIFDHDRIPLAVTTLGMSETLAREISSVGPKDRERAIELEALDQKIADPAGVPPTGLAEAMLEAALLARALGRPRAELDGRFLAARRSAAKHKNTALEFRIVYNWAWTDNFWFDDFAALSDHYGEAAALVQGSHSAELLSRLTNLWSLLRMAVSAGGFDAKRASLASRSKLLKKMLADIVSNEKRPNNALHARAVQLFVKMINRRHEHPGKPQDDVWNAFREILKEADGLGTFPFEEVADSLSELGLYIKDSETFDLLYAEIAEVMGRRRGEGESATILVDRASQKLEQRLPYEAISWFGQAIDRLVKKEYEEQLMRTLGGLSAAYDRAGLRWAARMCGLAVASHQVTSSLMTEGSVEWISPAIFHALYAIELELGVEPQ